MNRTSFAGRVVLTVVALAVVVVLAAGALRATSDEAQAHVTCYAYDAAAGCGACLGPESHLHIQKRPKSGQLEWCSYAGTSSGRSGAGPAGFDGTPGSPAGLLLVTVLAMVVAGGWSVARARREKFTRARTVT